MIDADRLKAALERFVRQVMSRVDYLALYPCTVVAQHDDGSLELRPDTPSLGPGLSRVPIRLGIPGASVKVKAKARVLLGFEGGDPQQPVATLWEQGGLLELDLTAETQVHVKAPKVIFGAEGDARPFARVGDIVECLPINVPAMVAIGGAAAVESTITFLVPALGVIDSAGTIASGS